MDVTPSRAQALLSQARAKGAAAVLLFRMVCPDALCLPLDTLVATTPTILPTSLCSVRATIHTRRGAAPSRTVLLLHGLSCSGPTDARVVRLARALALAGLRVVLPDFARLRELRVDGHVLALAAACAAHVQARADWAPHGEVALCAPCISAGLLLSAAAGLAPGKRGDAVSGALLIGSHADVGEVHRYVFGDKRADAYGRLAMVLNALYYTPRPVLDDFVGVGVGWEVRDVMGLLRATLDDDHLGETQRVSDAIAGAGLGAVAAYTALTDKRRASALGDTLGAVGAVREHYEKLSTVRNIGGLHARCVALVHGRNDDVVPASETRVLAKHLERCESVQEVRAVVTPLIAHGEKTDNARSVWDWVRMAAEILSVIAAFFCAAFE